MANDSSKIAEDFLELASEQRINILPNLAEKSLTMSKLSELLDATKPEVHRNINRLSKAGLVLKNNDGNYVLTTFGSAVLKQIPSVTFVSNNRKFFDTHTFGNLETKFIQRLGALNDGKQVIGFVKVLEKWKKIHENAEKYICNILTEIPYNTDMVDVVQSKLENNIPIKSIFSQKVIMPEDRKQMFEERGFHKFVSSGKLQRMIKDDVSISVLVTEKEAAVLFPNIGGELDMSTMFFSPASDFHEWCMDYFDWCWKHSTLFQESKLKT